MATDGHELKRSLGVGSDCKGGMADDIPEGVLDVWAEVPSRLLHSASTARQHPQPGMAHACCAIDMGVWDGLDRVRRLASHGAFDTSSSACRTDKHRNGKLRADETGGCVHAEGGGYGMDMQSTGAFATLDAYCTAASELSSALAMYLFAWMIVTVLFFITSLRKSTSFIDLFGCLPVTSMLPAC